MRLLHVAVAALCITPVALASHPVDHDVLGLYENFGGVCGGPLLDYEMDTFCNDLTGLVEVATDGYVLAIARVDDVTFTIKVRHSVLTVEDPGEEDLFYPVSAPVALSLVNLSAVDAVCRVAVDCNYIGFWSHGFTDDVNPLTGEYLHQRVRSLDATTWEITLLSPSADPAYASLVGVVSLEQLVSLQQPEQVRGFYNPAKLATPIDALDAVPYFTLV